MISKMLKRLLWSKVIKIRAIISTALIDTGSRINEVIFEFKGT